ncbi:hypothetical protein OBBRIDRAFT_196247 [Obba rivulosa]|uniref:Uncharacterized protein n=1 Tax=Obba rivulosa TaxID=1052685 RepID=A0A8E2DQQ6_9APHY|nr:hypothetical protein OBBRIDRAFT_196247 [Obba rivulosa]
MSFATYPPGKHLRDIQNLFPYIEDDVMAAVLDHTLSGSELYKLDSRRIFEFEWNLVDAALEDSTVALGVAPCATDIYKTLDALLVPLNAYFSIITVHGLARGQSPTLPCYFFRYSSHLVKLVAQYEWFAVLSYHIAFFTRRCREMRAGEYSGWARTDVDLMEEFLVPHQLPHQLNTKTHRKSGRIRG